MLVTLCMIVKNEAPVIRRCLEAARPLVDRWAICDTGSTDGTQRLVLEAMEGLPGALHEHPWVDFGHNRTRALEEARAVAGGEGYLLVVDADDTLVRVPDFDWPAMDLDVYDLLLELGAIRWWRQQIFRADQPWLYTGVLHEYPELVGGLQRGRGRIKGLTIRCGQDGARRRDKFKYLRDAEVLRRELERNPTDRRTLFYYAQSLRDAGQPELALDAYRQRWNEREVAGDEEAWYAKLCAGRIERHHGDQDVAAVDFREAFEFRPGRMEPVVELAAYHRRHRQFAMAKLWANLAISTPMPTSGLFVEPACFAGGWWALDEYGLAELFLGNLGRARRFFEIALRNRDVSAVDRARIEQNLACAGPAAI